ncbi:MAG TPA: LysM peptidoglycan-binding domain-containing protein [Clostridiaceae bacterium]|nr:LysM peptidoglycan-binding domain-containing protein [Clostridiaceae bacterium]
MNRVPADDPSWNMGFSGLLLSDGQFVALSSGSGRIYMMREGMFRPLASETSRAKKEIDIRMNEDAEVSELELPGDEERGSVIVSDIYNIQEGDSFILLSDGLYQALGEEKIEDLLALRSDSTYIAYRLVEEALKRKTTGDVTALVVQVEKVTASAGTVKKSAPRAQSRQTVKTRVDKLNKAPAITYKYDRRNAAKYKSTVLVVMVIISVMLLFGLVFKMIDSLMKTGSENIGKNPSTTTASPTLSPTRSPGETGSPADDPDETVTPTPTPTSTPTPTPEEQIHVVQKGDSMSAITRKYYGDTTLLNKLCKYNNISDPDKIIQGQKIKIPPIEVLKNLN